MGVKEKEREVGVWECKGRRGMSGYGSVREEEGRSGYGSVREGEGRSGLQEIRRAREEKWRIWDV